MLTNAQFLKGLAIHAVDGYLGALDHLLFDDETWGIRYLTVKTGGWLSGREVLISPISILNVDWPAKRLDVSLTKKQVEKSPDIDTHKPVSRQHEAEYLEYYGYSSYWGGPYMWGPAYYPAALAVPIGEAGESALKRVGKPPKDSHLRSAAAVTGYRVEATDGEIGHVDGFVVDDETWAIRYLEVATRNWLPGKKVLISPEWVESVSWEESIVRVSLTRKAIHEAPDYLVSEPITREFENQLYCHYGRPPYWLPVAERESSLVLG